MHLFRTTLVALSVAPLLCSIGQSHAFQSKSSALFVQVEGSNGFTENMLTALPTNDSITEATGMSQSADGSIYILGNIEATDSEGNTQAFANDEVGDRLGDQDIFLLKLSPNGSLEWSKRFGSQGSDAAQEIASDENGYIYIATTIARNMGDVVAGSVVFKYDGNGTRLWTKNFGSRVAGDRINGIAVNEDNSSEIIISGTIGAQSTLHTDATRLNVSSVVIIQIAAKDGELLGMSVGDLFNDSAGAVGNALTLRIANGTGICFVAGTSLVESGGSKVHNGAIYSFSYPELKQLSKMQVFSQTEDAFVEVATSNNWYSVFAVGIADVSIYSELDARVARFNASNLALGWTKSIETTTFPDQASIETGTVSEAARDVAVDEYGNVYVLLEASGPIGGGEAQRELKNKRPALVVYAPNGTVVHEIQSNATQPTSAQALLIHNGTAIVSGWTLDPITLTTKIYVAGVALPSETYRTHGAEYTPPKTTLEDNEVVDSPEGGGSKNIGIIAGATGGAIALLIVIGVAVAISMKGRNGNGQTAAL